MFKKIGISILTAFVLLSAAYISNRSNTNISTTSNTKDLMAVTHKDYPIAATLESLVSAADVIVIGEYKKFNKTWNMARDINDITKEDLNTSILGDIYDFNVTRSLKGELKHNSMISVNIRRTNMITAEDKTLPPNIQRSKPIIDERYIAPELNKKVVLFLKKDVNFGVYYAAMEPFQFEIASDSIFKRIKSTDNVNIKVKSNIESVMNNFSKGKKLKIKDISDAIPEGNWEELKNRYQ